MVGGARLVVLSSALILSACGAPAGQPASQQAPPAAPAPPPVMMMAMDVSPGTPLELTLETPVAVETAKAEDVVRASVAKPVVVAGMTVIPAGSSVTGAVVSAEPADRGQGRASVVVRFNWVMVADTSYAITTARIVSEGDAGLPAGAALKTTIDEKVTITAPM